MEIATWTPKLIDGEPSINAVYRFAPDQIAPRVRVEFTIEYRPSADGTEMLVYIVHSVVEEEAQEPQGA